MWNAAALTTEAFSALLRWLDDGADSGGATYLEMRDRLVAYFGRKRCPAPEDLADETLNRVARRLQETGAAIEGPPARYCYIMARYVFLEWLRSIDRRLESAGEALAPHPPAAPHVDPTLDETRLRYLDRCLDELSAPDRKLILDYYQGEPDARIERRRALASRLGLTSNALAIRASRIRTKLESCFRRWLANDRHVAGSSYRE
jgi:DNA-directed RNA polymerase specialized sigma24 family protein